MKTHCNTLIAKLLVLCFLAVAYPLMADPQGGPQADQKEAQASTPEKIYWNTNFALAQAEAKRISRPMLVLFTGSDWCGACKVLKKEVLDKPEFAQKMGENYIFVILDFPMRNPPPAAQLAANKQLQQQYDVKGYPTIIILDTKGAKLGSQVGYSGESISHYIEQLEGMKARAQLFDHIEESLTQEVLAFDELPPLYQLALELERSDLAACVMEAGLKDPSSTFFLAERFKQLMSEGQRESDEAHAVRAELLRRDGNNRDGQHLFVAVWDFQEALKEKDAPNKTIEPLVSYLDAFGEEDESRWKVEMTLSQYLYGEGCYATAEHYAQAGLHSAPDLYHDDIQSFINSLR